MRQQSVGQRASSEADDWRTQFKTASCFQMKQQHLQRQPSFSSFVEGLQARQNCLMVAVQAHELLSRLRRVPPGS